MKTIRLTSSFAAAFVIAGTTLAQTPAITSFQGNGQLTWTNGDTNLFYRIEWAPSLTAPDTWQSNYCALADIRSSASVVTSSVPMFYRVCGSSNRVVFASPVPKTGQTRSGLAGDDGILAKGVAWPQPRFTVGTGVSSNCVTDNLTGLIWARNANLGTMTWANAVAYCEGLTYGGTNDWRLPNVKELQSLLDFCWSGPSICNSAGTGRWAANDPFVDIQRNYYWSSTMVAGDPARAWWVHMDYGSDGGSSMAITYYAWPVRGGQ